MTDGPAPERQRYGHHDELVSVPVPDVSSASVNTTQTSEKKNFYGKSLQRPTLILRVWEPQSLVAERQMTCRSCMTQVQG